MNRRSEKNWSALLVWRNMEMTKHGVVATSAIVTPHQHSRLLKVVVVLLFFFSITFAFINTTNEEGFYRNTTNFTDNSHRKYLGLACMGGISDWI